MTEPEPFKIHALICVYNDHVALPFALDSVKDVCDSIIVADGAYDLYYKHYRKYDKNAKPWSTDGTLEILKSIPNLPPITLIECPNGKPWKNQVVKRNALLNAVPIKDWFLILDSDEMFYGSVKKGVWEIMTSGCIAGRVALYNVGLDISGLIPFWHPRIFLKLPGMHYQRKHWLLCDWAERVIEVDYPVHATDSFVLAHFKVFKDHRRLAPHMSYMVDMSSKGWLEPKSEFFMKQKKEQELEVLEKID